jgi:hypothetical protein
MILKEVYKKLKKEGSPAASMVRNMLTNDGNPNTIRDLYVEDLLTEKTIEEVYKILIQKAETQLEKNKELPYYSIDFLLRAGKLQKEHNIESDELMNKGSNIMTRIFKETGNLDILTNYAEKIQEINNS